MMPFDAAPTKERRTAATRECNADVVRTAFNILSFAQEKYKTSEWRWIRGRLHDGKGGDCLMGAVLAAADKVSPNASSRGPWWLDYRDTDAVATATHYLARAVVRKRRDFSGEHSVGLDHNLVVNFNNSRRFADVMNVLKKAKSLAEADVMPRQEDRMPFDGTQWNKTRPEPPPDRWHLCSSRDAISDYYRTGKWRNKRSRQLPASPPRRDKRSSKRLKDLFDQLLDFFGPHGERWLRGAWEDERGSRCLMGALNYFHSHHREVAVKVRAMQAIREAIQKYTGSPSGIVDFNDSNQRRYEDVRAVLLIARGE